MTSSGSLCSSSLLTGKLDTDNSLYALCIASIHTSAKCRLRYLLTTLTVACCWLLYDPHLSPCVLIQFDACHATVPTTVYNSAYGCRHQAHGVVQVGFCVHSAAASSRAACAAKCVMEIKHWQRRHDAVMLHLRRWSSQACSAAVSLQQHSSMSGTSAQKWEQ